MIADTWTVSGGWLVGNALAATMLVFGVMLTWVGARGVWYFRRRRRG